MDKTLYKLPKEFIERIKKIYPRQYLKVLNCFLSKRTPTFRTNLVKADTRSIIKSLKSKNAVLRQVTWYKNAFILIKPDQREFQGYGLYKEGKVYFQNLSSMLAVILLKPDEGEKILDLCAAPGGKTTQIVSEARAKAEIVAVEKVRPRFYKLCANLQIQGQSQAVRTELADGARIWKKYPRYFDKVLIDAPCSCEANFLANDPKTYSYWSYRKIKESQHKQKRLFFSGIKSLKSGGLLIYSTCTFAPEENEEVIQWALDKFKDEVCLEEIRLPINNLVNGLTGWKDKKFSESLKYTKRVIPTDTMEGFFLACLRKR